MNKNKCEDCMYSVDYHSDKLNEETTMSINYVNRQHDEDIIDIVRHVLDNGTGKAETANEHILIKLMQLRNTPITNMEFNQKNVDSHYNMWKGEEALIKNDTIGELK